MTSALVTAAAVTLGAVAVAVAVWADRRARALEARLERATHSLQHLQQAFSRFAPAMVVEEIIDRGIATSAEKKEVTVLFADLQGFTAMSEKLDPVTLVEILNGYFERMSGAIRDHHGHLAKFMGDGLMALFGALQPNPWQAKDAVEAALAMREALRGYNAELREKGLPTLSFGIGIHQGVAVAGVIGSQQLLEFTVIGDTVNLASRVEALTRSHGVDILVTQPVYERLRDRFAAREMPPMLVKGKSEPIRTFAVAGRSAVEPGP